MKTNYYVRSPFNYIGNKFRILDQIIPFFDEHQIFVDVFGGSGVVGVNVKNRQIIYNEIDHYVVKTMKYLYQNPFGKVDKKINSLVKNYDLIIDKKPQDLPILNQAGFNRLKDDFNQEKIKKKDSIPSFIGLIMFGFNSQIRYNSQGKFNIPVGKSGYTQFRRNNLEMFMKKFQEKEVVIYNSHYKNLVEKLTNNYQDNKDYFFYFDPPYLLSNAPYNSG